MCLLSFYPSGVMPNDEHLRNGALVNADGHGWALVTSDRSRIITFRTLDADAAIKTFMSARIKHPDTPAMFHSRWGTSGQPTRFNCHPFRVPGLGDTVLAHNGVLYTPPESDKRCDTRHFAEEVMPRRYFRLDKVGVQNALEGYLKSDKMVVLTVNPDYQRNAYLFGEQRGHWLDTGEWHSNYDYEGWRQAKYNWDNWSDCWFCGGKQSVGPIYGRCHQCNMCSYCGDLSPQIGACGCVPVHSASSTTGRNIVIGPSQNRYVGQLAVSTTETNRVAAAARAQVSDWTNAADNMPPVDHKTLPDCCDGHFTRQIPTWEPCQ